MSNHAFARSFGSLAIIVLLSAHGARAEVAAWDPTQVTALAKQLTTAADALYEALLKQPPPHVGSMQSQPYYRLKQVVRLLRTEAHVLESAVAQGARADAADANHGVQGERAPLRSFDVHSSFLSRGRPRRHSFPCPSSGPPYSAAEPESLFRRAMTRVAAPASVAAVPNTA